MHNLLQHAVLQKFSGHLVLADFVRCYLPRIMESDLFTTDGP